MRGNVMFHVDSVKVHNQRTQYKNMKEGKKPSITEQRIKLLEDIGFI